MINNISTLKTKFLRNLGANAYGQLITIVIQLVSIPLYLSFLGEGLYAEWLILSAIPAYLALSDIGFSSVAANDMTMRVAIGDKQGALNVYQSAWVFITIISSALMLSFFIAAACFSFVSVFDIKHLTEGSVRVLLFILIGNVFLTLQISLISAAFRSVGLYVYGTVANNSIRFFEWIGGISVLMLGGKLIFIAAAMLVVKFFGLIVLLKIFHNKNSWLILGVKNSSLLTIRRMLKPSLAFSAFPFGLAFALQGTVLVIGATIGHSMVVTFSTYRTLTRVLVQFITMINQAAWPEISSAYGVGNLNLIKIIHRRTASITLWISICAVLFLAIVGNWIVSVWTHGNVIENSWLLYLLLLITFINVNWQSSWVLMMAINRHVAIALDFLIVSSACLLASWFFGKRIGIDGIAYSLILGELIMMFCVIRGAFAITNDTFKSYIKSIFFFSINYK